MILPIQPLPMLSRHPARARLATWGKPWHPPFARSIIQHAKNQATWRDGERHTLPYNAGRMPFLAFLLNLDKYTEKH